MKLVLFLSAISVSLFGQVTRTIEVFDRPVKYKSKNCSIRNVDFANLRLQLPDPVARIPLLQGKFKKSDNEGFEEATLDGVIYLKDGNGEFAIVKLNYIYGGGSSNNDAYIFVFTCVNNSVINSQTITGDMHGSGAEVLLSADGLSLTVKSAYIGHGSHGAPELLETGIFKWRGTRYVLQSTKAEKIDYSEAQR